LEEDMIGVGKTHIGPVWPSAGYLSASFQKNAVKLRKNKANV